jgi:hypothetical protein
LRIVQINNMDCPDKGDRVVKAFVP